MQICGTCPSHVLFFCLSVVRAIRNGDPPGRFLKRDEKTGKWFDVGDKKAGESGLRHSKHSFG
jgi:hypothetical protein